MLSARPTADWIAGADGGALHLQPDRPDEVEDLLDDGVGHLGFADDVADQRGGLGVVAQLTAQEPGHHLDAGQRVLDLVGDGRGHLAQRRQPIAQPFALLELFDPGEVLEEHRRADGHALAVADERQRVAEHLVGRRQAQLGAVGEEGQFVGPGQHADDAGMGVEHLGERPPEVALAGRQAEDPARLVVDEHELAGPVDRQHAVAHVRNQVAEEGVVDEMGGGDRRAMRWAGADAGHRRFRRAAAGGQFGCGHDSAWRRHTQLSCLSPL